MSSAGRVIYAIKVGGVYAHRSPSRELAERWIADHRKRASMRGKRHTYRVVPIVVSPGRSLG